MFKKKPYLRVSWHLTRMCNYHCVYCRQKKASEHPASNKQVLEGAERIIKLFGEQKVIISFFGGEPLIHPAVIDIVKFFKNKLGNNCQLRAQTNGSQSFSFFQNLFEIDPAFFINQSVHLERVDEISLMDKIDLFCADGRRPKINLMFLPSYREKAKRICKKLLLKRQTKDFIFDISLIRSPESGLRDLLDDYTKEDFDWRNQIMKSFKKMQPLTKKNIQQGGSKFFIDYIDNSGRIFRLDTTYSEALRYQLLSFHGMNCVLGHRLIINLQGFLRIPCVGDPTPGKKVNIYKHDINEADFIKPIRCPKQACNCKADFTSPKYISKDHAPFYIGNGHPIAEENDIEKVKIQWVLEKLGKKNPTT